VFYHDDVVLNRGSAASFVKLLCSGLSRQFEVRLFVYTGIGHIDKVDMGDYTIYRVPRRIPNLSGFPGKLLNALAAHSPRLYKFSIETANADRILCIDPYSGLTVGLLAWLRRSRVMYRPNDSLVTLGKSFISVGRRVLGFALVVYGMIAEGFLVKISEIILAPSTYSMQAFSAMFSVGQKLVFCPYVERPLRGAVNDKSLQRKRLGLPLTKVILLFLGSTSWPPNEIAAKYIIDELAPYAESRIPNAHFLLVGQGTESCKQLVHTNNVTVVGTVKSVEPYLEAADYGLAPLSLTGGIAAKIVSYLTAGLPTIATPEAARTIELQKGLYVVKYDALKEAIASIVERKEGLVDREDIARTARLLYSYDHVMARVLGRIRV